MCVCVCVCDPSHPSSSPQPAGKMVAAAKAAVPTVGDQAAALQLGNFAKATAIALAELRAASTKVGTATTFYHVHYMMQQGCYNHPSALISPFFLPPPLLSPYCVSSLFTVCSPKAAEVCGSLEIDSAIDTVRALSRDLAEAKKEAKEGRLLPLPGESVESCAQVLGATSKTVGSSMAQLLTAANQGGDV